MFSGKEALDKEFKGKEIGLFTVSLKAKLSRRQPISSISKLDAFENFVDYKGIRAILICSSVAFQRSFDKPRTA